MREKLPTVWLERTNRSSDDFGSLGLLVVPGAPSLATLEPPWKNNRKLISCIPLGKYFCKSERHPRFGQTWLVTDVPGRSAIYFHVGNFRNETEGCILVGESVGDRGILRSKAGMNVLRAGIPFPNDFWLVVNGSVEKYGDLEE